MLLQVVSQSVIINEIIQTDLKEELSIKCKACFFYGCHEHPSQSQDVAADAGCLCNQAGVLDVAIKEAPTVITVFCLQVHWSTLWAPVYIHITHPATSCIPTYMWQGFNHIYISTSQHPTNRSSQSSGAVLCIRKPTIMNEQKIMG
jgi:hypothetical protein